MVMGHESYWAAEVSYAGNPAADSDQEVAALSKTVKQRILDAYAAIHARGIIHGDANAAGWCWRSDDPADESTSDMQIIDGFIHGLDLGADVEERITHIFKEIAKVHYLLDRRSP
ncbi:hypothetical protein CspeluHIS016_0700580 [Cutaneotrichosporon spelunceum]|uniref:Uncharacterized protein n=1 Tax=Cutaneotrichosporon spelunceum TaxID=1672016 RepID=A0AAD3TYD9_9TREE|nr:hypothetical protein CspeluHIS016_0700580 [Cutaneotrichosporon spelunceum]